MSTPDDFIEAEINKILAILEKQCKLFSVDEKPKQKDHVPAEEESEQKHVNG